MDYYTGTETCRYSLNKYPATVIGHRCKGKSPGKHLAAFTPLERRAAASLSLVYATRMMGLFLLLPVLSVLGQNLHGATPLLIGVALGIYGLFQAALQIPFGMLSDRVGRKRVIYFGLMLMVAGSLVAAMADSIWQVIAGRALQGAGAISAAVMALAADLSRDSQRTKMMAVIGASIGLSFVVSIMVGPMLMGTIGLDGIFLIIAASGVLSALLVRFGVPDAKILVNRDFSATGQQLREVMANRELQRLDLSILVLHLLITATFVCVPLGLLARDFDAASHWQIYLTACMLSLLILVPLIGLSERSVRWVMVAAIVGLGLAEFLIGVSGNQWWFVVVSLGLFFGFLNVLESMLPSLVSRIAAAGTRGTAMGVYSSSQFFGAFLGGVLGGWLAGSAGLRRAHLILGMLCLMWALIAYRMKEPPKHSTYQVTLGTSHSSASVVERLLLDIEGVDEVLVSLEDRVAYLKVNRKLLDEEVLRAAIE